MIAHPALASLILTPLMLAPLAALAQPAALAPAEAARFAASVRQCWIGPEQSRPTTIRFAMDPEGRPDPNSFLGLGGADQRAFAAARRAVLRCAGTGYDLPKDRYDAWKNVEMTFAADGIEGR